MTSPSANDSAHRQRGAVLLVAMLFLLLLTLMALASSNTSIMQERMTGGMRNRQLAAIAMENALRGGEEFLWNLSFDSAQPLPPCINDATDCVYFTHPDGSLNPKVQAFRSSTNWLDPATDGAREYPRSLIGFGGNSVTANVAAQPRYMIEFLGSASPGTGGSGGRIGRTGGAVLSEKDRGAVGAHFLYRITARSQGGTDAVVRVAESTFVSMNLTSTNFNPDDAP